MKHVERMEQTEDPGATFEDISNALYLALTTRLTRGQAFPRMPIEREPDDTPTTHRRSDGTIYFSTRDNDEWGNPQLEYIEGQVRLAKRDAKRRLESEWQEPEHHSHDKARFGKKQREEIFAELHRDLLSDSKRSKHLKKLGLREDELELALQILELNPDFNDPSEELVELMNRR